MKKIAVLHTIERMPPSTTLAPVDDRARQVCELIAEGRTTAEALKLARIHAKTFYERLRDSPQLASAYTRATELGGHILFDGLLAIPDTEADVQRARLKSDNLRWYLSKLNPGRYGDRLDVNVTSQVSVSDALSEAKARLVRPMRDQLEHADTQAIEYEGELASEPTDKESDPNDPLS